MSDTKDAIRTAILEKIPDASVVVDAGSGGHFTIQVVSPVFSGKNMVESQRLVYGAIAHLMKGEGAPVFRIEVGVEDEVEGAPVHAIDKLTTKTP